MMQYADVLESGEQIDKAAEMLKRLAVRGRADLTASIGFVGMYLRHGNIEQAQNTVRELEVDQREDMAVLEARGCVEIPSGEIFKARTTFDTMSHLADFEGRQLRQRGSLQLSIDDLAGARWALQKAAKSNPKDTRALLGLVCLELRKA